MLTDRVIPALIVSLFRAEDIDDKKSCAVVPRPPSPPPNPFPASILGRSTEEKNLFSRVEIFVKLFNSSATSSTSLRNDSASLGFFPTVAVKYLMLGATASSLIWFVDFPTLLISFTSFPMLFISVNMGSSQLSSPKMSVKSTRLALAVFDESCPCEILRSRFVSRASRTLRRSTPLSTPFGRTSMYPPEPSPPRRTSTLKFLRTDWR
mmetsp:Transcript_21284/g.39980  ORF Transcript_21284/g.39980 Transcript_21284/m.39980 type:complete len:208 (+) Transcript_21284:166-789(+)